MDIENKVDFHIEHLPKVSDAFSGYEGPTPKKASIARQIAEEFGWLARYRDAGEKFEGEDDPVYKIAEADEAVVESFGCLCNADIDEWLPTAERLTREMGDLKENIREGEADETFPTKIAGRSALPLEVFAGADKILSVAKAVELAWADIPTDLFRSAYEVGRRIREDLDEDVVEHILAQTESKCWERFQSCDSYGEFLWMPLHSPDGLVRNKLERMAS